MGHFSLPRFHTMLLQEGSMSRSVLQTRVRNWITVERGLQPSKRHWLEM